MSDTDDNQNLLELLETHRRRLRHLHQQAAVFDPGFVPSHVALGLADAYRDVADVKAKLRSRGVPVDDLPEDQAPPSAASPSRAAHTGQPSRFNIQGPIQAGAVNIGGLMNVDAPIHATFGGEQVPSAGDPPHAESPGESPSQSSINLLAAQIELALSQAPADSVPVTSSVARRVRALAEATVAPTPDRDFVAFQAESLRRAAAPLATSLPDIVTRIEQLISACDDAVRPQP